MTLDSSRKTELIRGLDVTVLMVFVDYDNVDLALTRAGPVSLAKVLSALIPSSILATHASITVRLYGGWRCNATLTTFAQRLVPDIRANSPCVISSTFSGNTVTLRLTVELAEKPIGATTAFEETFVRDRGLRKFKTLSKPWSACLGSGSCGLGGFAHVAHNSPCTNAGCTMKVGDLFVRDEQKMVDTLIVADIAHQALLQRATDVIVVSSDTDMWPGVLLALRAGCAVSHIHTKPGWRTQRHLMRTIGGGLDRFYQQLSV